MSGTWFRYRLHLAHGDVSKKEIIFFDANRRRILTVSPGVAGTNYEEGIYTVPSWMYADTDQEENAFRFIESYPAGVELTQIRVMQLAGARTIDSSSPLFSAHSSVRGMIPGQTYAVAGSFDPQESQLIKVVDAVTIGVSHPFLDTALAQLVTITPATPVINWIRFDDPDIDPRHPGGGYFIIPTLGKFFDSPQPALAGISTADYTINVMDSDIIIRWNRGEFLIHDSLFPSDPDLDSDDAPPPPDPDIHQVIAAYSFEVQTIPAEGIEAMLDGSVSTQTQVVYHTPPLPGAVFATIDLGSVKSIDAIDLVAGFFIPDDDPAVTGQIRFDFSAILTLRYSLNGDDYFLVSSESAGFSFSTGGSFSVERSDLGETFQARYLRIEIDSVERIEYRDGVWPISIALLNIFQDVILRGEAKLVEVVADPTTEVLDVAHLRDILGDRLFRDQNGEPQEVLRTQADVNLRAKNVLVEFNKNHTRGTITHHYHPGIRQGMTLRLLDTENGIDQNYFVEEVQDENGKLTIQIAYFP